VAGRRRDGAGEKAFPMIIPGGVNVTMTGTITLKYYPGQVSVASAKDSPRMMGMPNFAGSHRGQL